MLAGLNLTLARIGGLCFTSHCSMPFKSAAVQASGLIFADAGDSHSSALAFLEPLVQLLYHHVTLCAAVLEAEAVVNDTAGCTESAPVKLTEP